MLAGEDRAVQVAGLRVGVGGELAAQHVAQLLVLRERLLAPPVLGEQPHQLAVRRLVQRVVDDRALERRDRVDPLAVLGLQRRELDQQGELRLAQLVAARLRPVLEAVFGEQLTAVQRERVGVGLDRPGAAGLGRARLELVDVDPQPVARQGHDPVAQRQPRLRTAECAARRVHHLMERVRGRLALRPQQLLELLAVHPPLGREHQELDQRPRAPQSPRIVGDRSSGDCGHKPTEEVDLEQSVLEDLHAGEPTPGAVGPAQGG